MERQKPYFPSQFYINKAPYFKRRENIFGVKFYFDVSQFIDFYRFSSMYPIILFYFDTG